MGILSFLVGGASENYARATPILECMGENIIHCGDHGNGQAAKVCNNMLLAIGMIGTSEALQLGIRLGLDPKVISTVINSASGRCWSSEIYNPCPGVMEGVPSSNDYLGGFGTALMTKDLALAQTVANASGTVTPLGSLALQIYRLMTQSGYSGKDFSSVFKFLEEKQQ
jgi:3-hydroxyisobutyrate dehydrogenase